MLADTGDGPSDYPPAARLMMREHSPRLRPGQLVDLVLTHLRAHPELDYTSYELARVLGRSRGTVHRILLNQETLGTVARTHRQPARFRINSSPIDR